MKLIALSIAWVVGIYIGSLVSPPLYAFLLAFISSLVIVLLWRKRQAFIWAALCLIVLFGGIGCYQWRVSEPTIQDYSDRGTVELRGEVQRDPGFDGGAARLSLSAHEISIDGDWEEVSGEVLIYTTVFPSYSQGDSLRVKGELQARQGFPSIMSYPEIEFMQRGWLFSARNRLSDSLSEALSEPEGSLAQALLLGIRSHIPDTLMEDFRDSGTSHLVAISGLHLAIMAGVVVSGAAWVFGRHRPVYLIITFAAIWLYASLAGMRPPVFRAAIMCSLFLIALWIGRPRSALPSLAVAAAIMVGLDPSVLWDVSFQLSFVAVAGVMLLALPFMATWRGGVVSRLEGRMLLMSVTRLIVYPLVVTTAAIIAVYPLIAYYFGYVSVVGLPATFFALLALPGAIILALLTALLGLFAPALSWAMGCVSWLFLTYIIEVVEGFAALPFASYHVGRVSGAAIWAYYGVFVAILARRHLAMAISKPAAWVQARLGTLPQLAYRLPKRWVIIPLIVAAALIWLAVIASPGDERLEVSFLDVGQGDAILIETPSGQQILVDGGPDPDKICLELGEELHSWDKSLDLLVLTHAEEDHLLGLVEVLTRYNVGQVLESGLEKDTLAYEEWLRLIDEKDIERTIATAGQRIELSDGIEIEILHPQEKLMEGTESDVNNNSVVLRLYWNEVSFLLTGDIFHEAEREILHNGYELDSTILKVAHHGSASSTLPHFLTAVDPQVAVVCVGENTFGHPSSEVTERLENTLGEGKTYLTWDGTVTFTTDGKRLWVEAGK